MKGEKNYLTPKGYQKILDEIEQLAQRERPEVTKTVAWAAGNGDRSENADYIYGKKRLREIDKRLRFLRSRIANFEVVNPENNNFEHIAFGAHVEIEDENGESHFYTILGPDEIDPHKNIISYLSPIGKALMGKKVGDEVVVQSPKGEMEYHICSVSYKRSEE